MSLDIESIVRPGERVDLVPLGASLTSDPDKFFVSKVYDFSEDGKIELHMPMEGTKIVLLPVGAEYEATFYAKKGMYGCKVRVDARYKQDSLFILSLEQLTELEKQQRREFYRFDCVIGMNAGPLVKAEIESFEKTGQTMLLPEPEGKCVIVDISGGGIRFISAEHYEIGHFLRLKFILTVREEPRLFDLVFQLIATKPAPNNPKNTEYRGSFYQINRVDQDDIIRFIFEQERLHRQKK